MQCPSNSIVLCPKVLQRILRDSGCLLASALSFDGFNALGQMVSARYQDMKLYKDSVDIRMALADVAISTDVENKNSPLTYLSESIEAAKWYSEAAELYIGINEHRNFKEGGPSKALLPDHAGLAFKRAQHLCEPNRSICPLCANTDLAGIGRTKVIMRAMSLRKY